MYPQTGKRLLSVFAITDCLQIITGREFLVFDPCGQYLLAAGDDPNSSYNTSTNGGVGAGAVSGGSGAGGSRARGGAAGSRRANNTAGASRPTTSSNTSSSTTSGVQSSYPRAQRCFLVDRSSGGGGDSRAHHKHQSQSQSHAQQNAQSQDVLTRFPDQFAPHMSLPFRVQSSLSDLGRFPGILIRMVSGCATGKNLNRS
jgi:hypothetical protein